MQTLYLLETQAQLLVTGLLDSFHLLHVPVQSNSQCPGGLPGDQLRQEEEALRTTTLALLAAAPMVFFKGERSGKISYVFMLKCQVSFIIKLAEAFSYHTGATGKDLWNKVYLE